MSEDQAFDLTMELQDGYRFLVDFAEPGVPPLLLDEPIGPAVTGSRFPAWTAWSARM